MSAFWPRYSRFGGFPAAILAPRPEAVKGTGPLRSLIALPGSTTLTVDSALPEVQTLGLASDARAVVYVGPGRPADALADWQQVLNWVQSQPPAIRDRYLTLRNAWMSEVKAGKNPFDPLTLEKLRAE